MRERIRVFIAACFFYSGLVKLAHWRIRRSGKMLIILNYHRAIGNNLRATITLSASTLSHLASRISIGRTL